MIYYLNLSDHIFHTGKDIMYISSVNDRYFSI
jgi:hypothetical protein